MTMLHWMNCMTLTYAPHVLVYQASNSSSNSNFSLLRTGLLAGVGFILTQIVRLAAMSSFVPEPPASYSTLDDVIVSIFNIVDLLGLFVTVMLIAGRKQSLLPYAAVGLGWAFVESLTRYLIPLSFKLRSPEFDWESVEMGVNSNASLLLYIGICTTIWLWRRRSGVSSAASLLLLVNLAVFVSLPSLVRLLVRSYSLPERYSVVVRVSLSLLVAVISSMLKVRSDAQKNK